LSQTSQQHKRFHLRKRREETTTANDTSTASDADQAEICIQYGLAYKNDQGVTLPMNPVSMEEDWKYLLNDEDLLADINVVSTSPPPGSATATTQPPPMMQERTSSSTFSRFKRNNNQQLLKKDNSISSLQSLTPSTPPIKTTKRKKLRNRFRRRNNNNNNTTTSRPRRSEKKQPEGYAKFYSDIMGITFLEIESAQDLPPERNMTRTGFDMDPFVIVTYGTSTFRTRAIRHNLNPIWNEKLFFHVRNTQENYKIKFAVYDKDKFSGNDFVGSQELTISDIVQKMPSPSTTPRPDETADETPSEEIDRNMGRHTIPLALANASKWNNKIKPTLTIRAKFVPYVEIRKMFWTALAKTCDADSSNTMSRLEVQTMLETLGSNISEATLDHFWQENGKDFNEDLTMDELVKSLESFMQMADEKQMQRRNSNAIIEEAQDVPVDTKGTETKNPFFMAPSDDEEDDAEEEGYEEDEDEDDDDDEMDEEDDDEEEQGEDDDYFSSFGEYDDEDDDLLNSTSTTTSPQTPDETDYEVLAEADGIQYVDGPLKELALKQQEEDKAYDAASKSTHEKVIRLNECPICHKPNLAKRGQMDIVTHVATCAANDWTTVDRFLMGNFGTEAQAQRK
jgi:phosphatidylserine decarboxylase